MCWHVLKNIFLFWLLGCLLSLFFICGLQAQDIEPCTTILNESLKPKLQSLNEIMIRQSVRIENSERLLTIWQGQFLNLEAQHKILGQKSAEQEETIKRQELLLSQYEQTSEAKDKAHAEDISHYKWATIKWTFYGIGIGVSAGLLIAALVK